MTGTLVILLASCAIDGSVLERLDGSTPDAAEPRVPSWRDGQSVYEWREIPGSSLSILPGAVAGGGTGPSARIGSWTGLSIDRRSAVVYSTANGGHWEYPGNEVVAIELSADAPRWRLLLTATPPELYSGTGTHHLDGHPISRQSFYANVFIPERGRSMAFGGDVRSTGDRSGAVDGYDPVANDWDAPGTYPDLPAGVIGGAGYAVAIDDDTGDVYVFAAYAIHRWIEASNRWSTIVEGGRSPLSGFHTATATDTRRHRILAVGGESDPAHTLSLDDFSVTPAFGAAGTPLAMNDMGMVFVRGADASDDAFFVRTSEAGPTVTRIDPETFEASALVTTGGESIPPSSNGVLRRFLYAPTLGGVVYYPRYDANLWFLRTD